MKSFRQSVRSMGLIDPPVSAQRFARQYGLARPVSLTALIDMIKPEEASFSGSVVTPAGTALGGSVDLTLRSNGTYTFKFHMHDSGAVGYDFMVRAIFVTTSGMTFVAQHSGHVGGTLSSGSRDDDYLENGTNPFIRFNWPDVRTGKLWITKEYSTTGVVEFVEDLAKAVLDIAAGTVGGALGVVIGLGAEVGQLFGNLGVGGTFGVIAGVVVFAFGGSLVLAIAAGAAVGAMTNALIKQRPLSSQESEFAATVFGNSLPPANDICLTNLSGLGGRAFTMPGIDGKIYINLGDAYDNPLKYKNNAYLTPGQVLIHELTHAWQVVHASFLPGTVCRGIVNQTNNTVGGSVYVYGPPGPLWSDFNLEQQGAIVDQWFGGIATAVVPRRTAMDPNDPYFVYIRDNVRTGRA